MEKDCLALSLSSGDESTHFTLLPRFKVRHEGSPAYFADMAVFAVTRLPGYYLRATETPFDPVSAPGFSEINLGPDGSSFKLTKYKSQPPYTPPSQATFRTNEDTFSLFHPESTAFLSASCNPNKTAATPAPPTSPRSKMPSLRTKTTPPAHRPYLRPAATPNPAADINLTAKGAFVFELPSEVSAAVKTSEPVLWSSDVMIRHVATNKYVQNALSPRTHIMCGLRFAFPPPLVHTSCAPRYLYCDPVTYLTGLSLTPPTPASSLFQLTPTEIQEPAVPKRSISLRLQHVLPSNQTLYLASVPKRAPTGALDTPTAYIVFSPTLSDNDALVILPTPPTHVFSKTLHTCLSFLPTLEFYNEYPLARWEKSDTAILEDLLTTLIYSTDDFFDPDTFADVKASKNYSPLGALSHKPPPSATFQRLARQTKLIDAVFRLATATRRAKPRPNTSFDDATQTFTDPNFAPLATTIKLSWHSLTQLFTGNRDSENYFAAQPGYINPGIIAQIADPIGAALAFSQLITDNAALLKDHIDTQITQAFLDLLRERPPQARLLEFFSSIMVCQDLPIISNQEMVLQQLILTPANRDQILLRVADSEERRDFEVNEQDPWAVSYPMNAWEGDCRERRILLRKQLGPLFTRVCGSHICLWQIPTDYLGKSAVEFSSLQRVEVSWENIPSLSNFKIDDKHYCTLAELTSILTDKMIAAKPSDLTPHVRQQRDLGMYLVAQITLLSNLVYGRSYNCIAEIEKQFSYTMLIGVLSDTQLPNVIRLAFTQLMHRLYVDRYPHAPNCGRPSLPDLAWVYASLAHRSPDEEKTLPAFDLGEHHPLRGHDDEFMSMRGHTKFFLLRDWINKYLADMDGQQTIGLKVRTGCSGCG